MKEHDVIIVGGGMVGLLTALAFLQCTSLSVALLDEKTVSPIATLGAYLPRVSAITPTSQAFFAELGVWEIMQQMRVSSFKEMLIWDDGDERPLHFDASDIGKQSLGFIIENEVMTAALYQALSAYTTFQLYDGVTLQAVSHTPTNVQLVSDQHDVFSARLLIGADGARSWVRSQAGIAVSVKSYDVTAIVATVKTALPHEESARQVFLETGPLAFLPLQDQHHASIVWSLPSTLAREKMSMALNSFSADLTTAFSARLGEVHVVGDRHAFSLSKQIAQSYCANRTVLVGDAAHVVHPLAGQGVNLGIQDVIALRDVLCAAMKQKRDIASPLVLRRYERTAKTNADSMMKAIDGIHHLFVEENARYRMVRRAGMQFIESCAALKQRIVRFAI